MLEKAQIMDGRVSIELTRIAHEIIERKRCSRGRIGWNSAQYAGASVLQRR